MRIRPTRNSFSAIASIPLAVIFFLVATAPLLMVYAAAPTVVTLVPGVASTQAFLAATVNPNGESTLWDLVYAPAGQSVYTAPAHAGCYGALPAATSARSVFCTVSGLTPNTAYHTTVRATNPSVSGYPDKWVFGADIAFTTLPGTTTTSASPTVATDPAEIRSTTAAVLHGTVNPHGNSVGWSFRLCQGVPGTSCPSGYTSLLSSPWMTPTGCQGTLPAETAPVAVSCEVNALTPGASYAYAAQISFGESLPAFGSIQTFSMPTGGTTTVSGLHSDWAILSTSMNPTSPHVGDGIKFSMTVSLLSTNAPLPQLVHVQCLIDVAVCGEGTITYSAGVGGQHQVHTEVSWTATEGTHVVTWTISSDNDPNPSNNFATQSFTVASAGTQTQTSTTPTMATATLQTTSIETSQTQSSITQITTELAQTTQQQTGPMTVTVTSELAGGVVDMLQQNSLLIIGALAILLVILAVALIGRRPVRHEPETSKPLAGANRFCPSCGTENPSTSQFCGKCGSRLI